MIRGNADSFSQVHMYREHSILIEVKKPNYLATRAVLFSNEIFFHMQLL